MEFFKNKKIFITGHTGFKGSWLSRILLLAGAELKGYALPPETKPALFNLLGLGKEMQSVFADINDAAKLKEELQNFAPDIVLHLAAQPIVRVSYKEPLNTFKTNVMGTLNLLETLRGTKSVRAAINVTSDKCYENTETARPYKEGDALGGFDPYSCSKAVSELVTNSYRSSFFNPKDYGVTHNMALATARAGNVIGGGDYAADRIAPDCARALSAGKKIILRNPCAVRPWQHVLEPLCGYLLLAKRLYEGGAQYAGAFNFGPRAEDTRTVEDLAKLFIEVWGRGVCEECSAACPHEAKLLRLDITKAREVLNWRPLYNFDKAVRLTAQWYKAYENGDDVKELTVNQIKEYLVNYGKFI